MIHPKLEYIKKLIIEGNLEGVIYDCGIVYQGGLYRGNPHGKGNLILPNGVVLTSSFQNGKFFDGSDLIVYPSGHFYIGESLDGQPHGIGTLRDINGLTYFEGLWHEHMLVWLCTNPMWYEDGDVFQLGKPVSTLPGNDFLKFLHPAICREVPSWLSKSQEDTLPVAVMFPHLKELGCPDWQNHFSICGHSTPARAVKCAGFDDLEHYIKWVNVPELVVLERLQKAVKSAIWGIKTFGFFSHEHSFWHKASEQALEAVEKIIERERHKYYRSN